MTIRNGLATHAVEAVTSLRRFVDQRDIPSSEPFHENSAVEVEQ